MSLTPPPRSVRNSNPGNLERTSDQWAGLATRDEMTPAQQAETRFCVFRSPMWGFRALAIVLRSKFARGLNTVRKIITDYAPPNENDTKAYIETVCTGMGVEPDRVLNLVSDSQQLIDICRAIATQEGTGWHFNPDDLRKAVEIVMHPPVIV